MTIESTPFGPVKLSGEDASQFREQINDPQPQKAADTIHEGLKLAEVFAKQGYIKVGSPFEQNH